MSNLTLDQYMKLNYPVEVEKTFYGGKPGYFVKHPDLPGCQSDGRTLTEALANLDEAKEDYIRVMLKYGKEVSLPKGHIVEAQNFPQEHYGRVVLFAGPRIESVKIQSYNPHQTNEGKTLILTKKA